MGSKSQGDDLEKIELSPELKCLALVLAEKDHETWLETQFQEGWKYGESYLPDAKLDPNLISFSELPLEEQRKYLKQSRESLRRMKALGCTIEAPVFRTEGASTDSATENLLERVDSSSKNLTSLLGIWQSRDSLDWPSSSTIYEKLGKHFLRLGEPLVAYDVLAEGLSRFPASLTLQLDMALALLRSGAPESAEEILSELLADGHGGEEILGLKARVHKDLWEKASNAEKKQRQLRLAYETYLDAYKLTGGYWTGINAATMALIYGKREEASRLAMEVREQCEAELRGMDEGADQYWALATLGEAALIMSDWTEAKNRYSQAAALGEKRLGDLSSTCRNARLLLGYQDTDSSQLERCFNLPKIAVFTGHMIDHPQRAVPRFPPELEEEVRGQIRERLAKVDARVGYASAACGGDILFLEELIARGGEAYVVLPFAAPEFVKESVDFLPGSNWTQRFNDVCERASEVIVASGHKMEGGGVSFEYANLLLQGLANIRARRLGTETLLLTVWDGKRGDGAGGTESMIESWRGLGRDVEIIDLKPILEQELPVVAKKEPQTAAPWQGPEESAETSVKSILFADVASFSQLSEDDIPRFAEHFLGGVSKLIAESTHAPEVKNTWGDGLYFAFSSVEDAGIFALDLRDLILSTNWLAKGFNSDLELRIALHVGPVYGFIDPVTRKQTYFGTHVSQTARIEPITPPGRVYASQAFAALAANHPAIGFICEYVGQTPLAKGFGTFPTYHVRRTVT